MNVAKLWASQLDDYVIDLTWSPDGKLLAAASAAGPIALLDGATGAKLHELSGHVDGTNAIAFAPAPQTSAIEGQTSEGGGQKTAVRPEMSGGSGQASYLPAPTSDVRPLTSAVCPLTSALFASGGQDGMVRLWDVATGRQTTEADAGHGSWVEHLQWRPMVSNLQLQAPNGNRLAVTAGRKLLLLNSEGSQAHVFENASRTLSALAWHPRGGAVAVATFGRVVVLEADDFRVQRDFAYGCAIETLVWSPDGRWLVAGAHDNAVHLWIPEEDQEFHMSGYETMVRELSFSSDSRWLATGGARDACVWDCTGAGPEGREPIALPHGDRVCAVAFQHARGLLATAALDGEVGLWSLANGETRLAVVKLTAPASTLVWSPDDTLLAIGSQKGGVLVLRVED